MLRILFFGRLTDISGRMELCCELPSGVTNTRELARWLGHDDRPLGEALAAPTVRVAVDGELVHGAGMLTGGEEVAFMPPVSGG